MHLPLSNSCVQVVTSKKVVTEHPRKRRIDELYKNEEAKYGKSQIFAAACAKLLEAVESMNET